MEKLHFDLINPCNQNWEAMTLEDNGRYCNACEKTVVDFEAMTNKQIFDFFKNKKERHTLCGRFSGAQLSKGIPFEKQNSNWKQSDWKHIAVACLRGLSIAGTQVLVKGQSIIEVAEPAQYQTIHKKKLVKHASVISIQEPPVYDTIQKRVMVKPQELKTVPVPPEYTTVKSRRLVWQGGFAEYRELSCIKPIKDTDPIPVSKVQQRLKALGYYNGTIDNILGPKTKQAVIDFRTESGMRAVFEISPILLDLLGVTQEK